MMKRFFLLLVFIGLSVAVLSAQDNKSYTISGSVLNKSTGKPVEYATVLLMSTEQWAVADAEGKFTIQNVQPGKNVISISCLGFVTDTKDIVVSKDIRNYTVSLAEDNLTLESVVVTAQDNSNSATTSRTIDRTALDHIQNFTYDPKEKREWTWEEWNQLQAERRAKEEEKQKHLKGVDIDHAPGTPAIYINENADIPEIYWSAFEHYCDLHPVKNAKQAKKRRIKFIKMVNKQYKKTYGHMATGKIKKGDKWDTVKYASVCIDKERMMENLKRIRKENVARMDYMKKQMEKWIKTNQISSEAGQKMLAHARKVRKNMQERLDDLVIDVRANGFPDVPLPDS